MAKLTLDDLASLTNETSAINTINNNNADIEAAIENTLSRDGTIPNQMEADFDMNGNQILNLPDPVTAQEPATKSYVDALALGSAVNTVADSYDTRAEFVADITSIPAADGKIISAGGRLYVYVDGSTAISDLPNWEPFGDVSPDHWGIAQQTDQQTKLDAMVNWAFDNKKTVVWPADGDYYFSGQLAIVGAGTLHWKVEGGGQCSLKATKTTPDGNGDADYAILVRGQLVGSDDGTADIDMGENVVTIASTSAYSQGDLVQLRSTRLIQSDNQGTNREGQICKIDKILDGTTFRISDTAQHPYKYNDTLTGAIVTVNSTTSYELAGTINRQERDMLLKMTLTSGANSGAVRYISAWDNSTKDATFDVAWPAGTLAGDTYLIEWVYETVHARPAKVYIEPGIRLYRDETTNATGGDEGFVGWRFQECSDSVAEGLIVENFSASGIRVLQCYNFKVLNPYVAGANRVYSTSNGTGYGIVVVQSWNSGVEGGSTHRCRRGADLGGAQIPSWYCYVRKLTVNGGGTSYDGNDMFPVGTHICEGWGSHGPAFNSIYEGNVAINCSSAVNLRGMRERVLNCAQYGHCGDYNFLIRSGGGHYIDGFFYDSGFIEYSSGATTRHNIPLDAGSRPNFIFEIRVDDIRTVSPITIRNVEARGINRGAIRFGNSGTPPPINIGNVFVWADNEDTAVTAFEFFSSQNAIDFKAFYDMGGNGYILPDSNTFTSADFADYGGNIDPATGYYLVTNSNTRTFFLEMADDTALQIPINGGMIIIESVFDLLRDRIYRGTDIILANDRTVNYASSNQVVNIEYFDVELTGTTGTDGKLNFAFRPDGGNAALYVENRTGSDARPVLKITVAA